MDLILAETDEEWETLRDETIRKLIELDEPAVFEEYRKMWNDAAGSVVVHDVPAGTFAAGNPGRVIRKISEEDSMMKQPERLGGYRV